MEKTSQSCVFCTVYIVKMASLSQVCCCCWEQFGVNSKSLRPVNETVEGLIQMYIFAGYSITIEHFPKKICSTCVRNLYLLQQGKDSRAAWGKKISQVFDNTNYLCNFEFIH